MWCRSGSDTPPSARPWTATPTCRWIRSNEPRPKAKRVYATWDWLDVNLEKLYNRQGLLKAIEARYREAKPMRLKNWASLIWPSAHERASNALILAKEFLRCDPQLTHKPYARAR
jgi:hypothetical protein